MTKHERVLRALRDGFSPALATAFKKCFSVEVETTLNIFDGALITARKDGEPLDQRQRMFIEGFAVAWNEATGYALAGAA